MSFNSPFSNFFDTINDEVNRVNRILSSNGFDSTNSKSLVKSDENSLIPKSTELFPKFLNSSFFDTSLTDIVPPVDILDNSENYELHISIPGVDSDKINLHFDEENNSIQVSGEIPGHSKEKVEKNLRVSERSTGRFERVISLPKKIDGDNIKATTKNGILTLIIPKSENEAIKKIDIKPASD